MKQFIVDLFLKNWQYKLLAFIVALGLWYYVVREQNMSMVISAPVEFTNYPENLKLKNDFKNTADLLLNGRRDIMTNIKKKDLKVVISLKNSTAGRNPYTIIPKMVTGLPAGVAINDITPARIILNFEAPAAAPDAVSPAAKEKS
jgi:YbbR domain-containing protein